MSPQVADYLTSTEGAGDAGTEGTFPAIDISDDFCGLFSYARQHSCVTGDNDLFASCRAGDGSLSTDSTVLHHRLGLRLMSGVVEAVSVIHPDQYDAPGAAPVVCLYLHLIPSMNNLLMIPCSFSRSALMSLRRMPGIS